MSKKRPRGRAFPKGQSANPRGRPKRTPEQKLIEAAKRRVCADVKAAAREFTVEAIATLAKAMRAVKAPWAARVSAADSLLDRGWGRPAQAMEIGGKEGAPIEYADVSARALIEAQLVAIGARLVDEGDGAERLN